MRLLLWRQTAVIAVDIQNDFCPGGALAVKDGDEVVDKTNRLFERAFVRVATRDHHPLGTNHGGEDWPPHCIIGTPGAEFHPELELDGVAVVSKGMEMDTAAYSGFEGIVDDTGQELHEYLLSLDVHVLIVTGLATDYCVERTVLDALKLGYMVIVPIDACRAVNVRSGDEQRALARMMEAGAIITTFGALMAGRI